MLRPILLSLAPLAASLYLLAVFAQAPSVQAARALFDFAVPWIRTPWVKVDYALFIDGLSLPLVLLTTLVTTLSLVYSEITDRAKEYFALFRSTTLHPDRKLVSAPPANSTSLAFGFSYSQDDAVIDPTDYFSVAAHTPNGPYSVNTQYPVSRCTRAF